MDREQVEKERGAAIAGHVKRLAEQYPGLRFIRKLLFGSSAETVSQKQALSLLASPGTQLLGRRHFEPLGIPWADHRAKVEDVERRVSDDADWRDYRVRVRWPGEREGQVLSTRITLDDTTGRRPRMADLPSPRGVTAYVVHDGTWLAALASAAEIMAVDLGWTTAEAALFILTGEAPDLKPLRAEVRRPAWGAPVIVLRVQPYTDIRSVERAYRAMQQRLDGGRVFRQRRRPVQQRALRLFDFVEQRSRPFDLVEARRRLKSWSQVMEAWNRRYPEWRYEAARALRRDYVLARERLLRGFKDHAKG